MINPFNYLHLANPLYTLINSGEDVKDTPAGYEFSDNPRLNLAIWNAIGVAGTALPVAYLINTLVNRKTDADVESKMNKSLVSKLEAQRPRLVADPNLLDTSSFTELPKAELKELEELKATLSKSASDEDEEGFMDWMGDKIKGMLAEGIYAGIPMATLPAAAIAGITLATETDKKRIKKRLQNQRMQLRNIQAYVDKRQLEEAGLVKADKSTESVKDLNDKMEKSASIHKASNSLPQLLLSDVPMVALTGGSAILGGALYNVLKDKDENLAIIDYLKKRQLGSNVTQETPRLSVVDLPVDPRSILATPGDKNEELAYEDPADIITEYKGSKSDKKNAKGDERKKSDDDSKNSKNSKKDAIF